MLVIARLCGAQGRLLETAHWSGDSQGTEGF